MLPVIQIGDGFFLPSYFTVIAIAYCCSVVFLYYRCLHLKAPISIAMDLALLTMVGGFAGSRLFHVFYELPRYYYENPLDIVKFWQGGFVFYGGAITAFALCWYYLKRQKQNHRLWMDVFAPIVPFTYFIGRFATLLSGSGYGKPTSLPWGITYPPGTEAPSGVALHPTPIYAMIFELTTLFVILRFEKKTKLPAGVLFGVMVFLHGVGRLTVEQFRDDLRGATWMNLSISSWISVALIIGATYFIWKSRRNQKLEPKSATQS